MNKRHCLLTGIIIGFTATLNVLAASHEDEDQVDFVDSIQPILKRSCYSCHAADKQEGGLRLDHRDSAMIGGDSGPIVVKQRPADSLMLQLIAGLDDDRGRMPPEGEGTPLTKQQIDLFRQWIQQGANWPETTDVVLPSSHWSFQPIQLPELPTVKNKRWGRTAIDRFVLAGLEERGVAPSPEANRGTLLRRLYLDVLGLLPPPNVAREFLANTREDAYRIAVERVLASNHYGERWGRHWLDLARYADSDGYEKDRPRPHAWRYRDWVINALNADMPFDQFTVEQLAGDLLPDASVEMKVATGFHRNTLHNTEGGTDKEEDRVKKTVDRTNTFGSIWMGLTVGCSQCHSHKYDPISHREYYQLYSFFNDISEQDIAAPTVTEQLEFAETEKEFQQSHQPFVVAVQQYTANVLPMALENWLTTERASRHTWVVPPSVAVSSKHGTTFKKLADASWLAEGPNESSEIYTITVDMPSISGFRLEVLPDDSLPVKGPGRADNGNFVLTMVTAEVRRAGTEDEFQKVLIARTQADFSQQNWQVEKSVNTNVDDGWAVSPQFGKSHQALFQFANGIQFAEGVELRIQLEQKYASGRAHNIGRFRISTSENDGELTLQGTPANVGSALAIQSSERNAKQQQVIMEYFKTHNTEYLAVVKAEREHAAQAPKAPATKAQSVVEISTPRQGYIHLRGNFLTPGSAVETSGFMVLPPVKPREEQVDRLDLAQWTVSEDNPLTARVTINRIWQRYFGVGLVATSDDFGKQGELPSHSDLLDWLAHEFRSQGWSLKHIHRLILTSSVYRQASATRSELTESDPDNRWLARQHRARVEAEIVRDLALDASALLSHRVGGPSVKPPQPSEYASLTYANSAQWSTSSGDDKYRRGLYTFFQRTSPYPMLMAFDSPDSTQCVTQRSHSNTPLQALTLWNDRVFHECAQRLALRVLTEVPSDNSSEKGNEVLRRTRIKYLFLTCLSRYPTDSEYLSVVKYLDSQLSQLTENPKNAETIIGERPFPQVVATPTAAAWVALGRVVLNLDEFITKE
ncbi:MAG: DUF1553 domain-containing protein [Planctomycetaceae bacterium]|nr:DUF1553 domain-containing protein [Planctomycetaceae bacterium]